MAQNSKLRLAAGEIDVRPQKSNNDL